MLMIIIVLEWITVDATGINFIKIDIVEVNMKFIYSYIHSRLPTFLKTDDSWLPC
jgi:hypothetical protein